MRFPPSIDAFMNRTGVGSAQERQNNAVPHFRQAVSVFWDGIRQSKSDCGNSYLADSPPKGGSFAASLFSLAYPFIEV